MTVSRELRAFALAHQGHGTVTANADGQRLEEWKLLALFVDGVIVAQQAVVVALGITRDGTKTPLGLCPGSTENAAVGTQLLQDLLRRGLKLDGRVLGVIDGGKGVRKALEDVLGAAAVIQRCQLHKARNLEALVPKARQAYVRAALRRAYRASSAAEARRQLHALATWLEANGHPDAAASLREGLEETLSVLKLPLPRPSGASSRPRTASRNLIATLRHVARHVKRWRSGEMIRRWAGLGLRRAAGRFRRIKGHRELAELASALRPAAASEQVAGAAPIGCGARASPRICSGPIFSRGSLSRYPPPRALFRGHVTECGVHGR